LPTTGRLSSSELTQNIPPAPNSVSKSVKRLFRSEITNYSRRLLQSVLAQHANRRRADARSVSKRRVFTRNRRVIRRENSGGTEKIARRNAKIAEFHIAYAVEALHDSSPTRGISRVEAKKKSHRRLLMKHAMQKTFFMRETPKRSRASGYVTSDFTAGGDTRDQIFRT